MKSFLYAGAVLMIGASIYGFVDYKKTSHDKKFKALYHEEKKVQPVVNEKTETPVTMEEDVPEINDVKKEMPVKKNIINKDIEEEVNNTPIETSENKTDEVFTKRKIKKEKKLNYKLFSRAPLREYEEEPVIPKVKYLKTEEAKSVNQ